MEDLAGTYDVSADRYYQAKSAAVALFLKEFQIPGKPYIFLTQRKHDLEITVKSKSDHRVGIRPLTTNEYFMEQIDNLLTSLRTSPLKQKTITKSSSLLQKAKEIISVG